MKKKKNNRTAIEKTLEQKRKELRSNYIIEGVILTLITFYFCASIDKYQALHPRAEFMEAITGGASAIAGNLLYFLPINYNISNTLMFSALAAVGIFIAYTIAKVRIHHNPDTLKGRTKWANIHDILDKYAELDKNYDIVTPFNNYFCGDEVAISLNNSKCLKAQHFLIFGTTGSGKSYGHVKPNILQMNSCYVVTDPSGDLTKELGECMKRFGYRVRIFDINSLDNCNTYNPLKYCKTEASVKVIVDTFIESMKKEGQGSSQDPFWDDSMNAFMCACISLLCMKPEGSDVPYGQISEIMGDKLYVPCFGSLTELTRMANTPNPNMGGIPLLPGAENYLGDGKNNTAGKSMLAHIFANLRVWEAARQSTEPDFIVKPYTLREWENFKIAPEKTSTTILMTTAVKLDAFNIEEIKRITSTDTINLDDFGNQKDILFMIIPSDERAKTYGFLAAFLYTQLFSILSDRFTYELEDSYNIFAGDDFIRHFSKEQKEDADTFMESLKTLNVKQSGNDDDPYYDIVDGNGNIITTRPTKELANEELKALQKATLSKHRIKGLPFPVRFMLDEFANTGKIPAFKEKLATVRKQRVYITAIVQNLSQLKGMYPDDWSTIDGNCPFVLFLGGDDNETTEYISKKIGQETVTGINNSVDSRKISNSYQIEGRELLRQEDVGRIDYNEEILFIYGEQPIFAHKFDFVKHKRYKYTWEGNDKKKYIFDRKLYKIPREEATALKLTHAKAIPNVAPVNEDALRSFIGYMGPDLDDKVLDQMSNYFDGDTDE